MASHTFQRISVFIGMYLHPCLPPLSHSSFHLASYFCVWLFIILISIPFVIYFCADHLTLPSSIPLATYFWADHFTLHLSIRLASYFRLDHLILHPSARVIFVPNHITLHPYIPLASYFCAVHPLGKLFLCLLFSSPSFGALFSCRPCNSTCFHPFGELFL